MDIFSVFAIIIFTFRFFQGITKMALLDFIKSRESSFCETPKSPNLAEEDSLLLQVYSGICFLE